MEHERSIIGLIKSSDKIIEKIESGADTIRLSQFARILDVKIQDVCKLLEKENIFVKQNPNSKISTDLLKQLILRESELSYHIELVDNSANSDEAELVIDQKKINEVDSEKLKELNEKIQSLDAKPYTKSVILNQFARNEYIREYAKIRANGFCELCEAPAPFQDIYGEPFLETHHVIFLSKGGEDSIENVVALCPNCHRKVHNLNLEEDVEKLKLKLENQYKND